MLVFAVIGRWLWNWFRLPKQYLPWYESAKRHWTVSLPGTLWGCIGYLSMPEFRKWNYWQAHKRCFWSRYVGPEQGLLDLSFSLESIGKNIREYKTW